MQTTNIGYLEACLDHFAKWSGARRSSPYMDHINEALQAMIAQKNGGSKYPDCILVAVASIEATHQLHFDDRPLARDVSPELLAEQSSANYVRRMDRVVSQMVEWLQSSPTSFSASNLLELAKELTPENYLRSLWRHHFSNS